MANRAARSHSVFSRLSVHRQWPCASALALVSAALLVSLMVPGRVHAALATGGGSQQSPAVKQKQTVSQPTQQPGPVKDPNAPGSLGMTPEQQYLLLKLQIEREMQDDILKWAQTRFWILAVVSLVIGFFGVRSLVREMVSSELKDAMRASAEANAAATQGKDAVKEVRAEAAKYSTTVEELTTAARTVDQKFRELSSRIDAEGTRSVAAADLKISAIDLRLSELRGMVEVLAKDSEGTRKALAEFEARRMQAERSVASTQAEFDDNSRFNVIVIAHRPGSLTEGPAHRVVDALSKLGFKASSGTWANEVPVGDSVRIKYIQRARKKAESVRDVVAAAIAGSPVSEKPIELSQATGSNLSSDIAVFF